MTNKNPADLQEAIWQLEDHFDTGQAMEKDKCQTLLNHLARHAAPAGEKNMEDAEKSVNAHSPDGNGTRDHDDMPGHLPPTSTPAPAESELREAIGKCSKTGIKYSDAIKELQEIIADCDAYGSRAKTPLPVRIRVLADVLIEASRSHLERQAAGELATPLSSGSLERILPDTENV